MCTSSGPSGSSDESNPTGVPRGEFSSTVLLDNVRLTGGSLTSKGINNMKKHQLLHTDMECTKNADGKGLEEAKKGAVFECQSI